MFINIALQKKILVAILFFFLLSFCVCVCCCFALAFPQIAAPSGFAGCSCMVKLLANKKWFDWGESCSRAALFNGGEVNFNLGWVVLLLSLTSVILIKEFLSIYRSDSEILGPNNQYLPKIVAVFAEVSFSWLYWLSTLNFSAWLSNNENVLVTSKDVCLGNLFYLPVLYCERLKSIFSPLYLVYASTS